MPPPSDRRPSQRNRPARRTTRTDARDSGPSSPRAARGRVEAALERRAALLAGDVTNAVRLLHAEADGVPGLVIEKFADVLIVQLHEGRLRLTTDEAREHCAFVMERVGARSVYRKLFPRDRSLRGADLEALHNDPSPWIGAPADQQITIREHGQRYRIRPWCGYSVGLFLEQRENRARVRNLARDRRVLNTFAYTCGFAVAAAAGGAAKTVNIDVSRAFLDWGRANFAANKLPCEQHAFIRSDVLDFLQRAGRRGETFDLIVLDPPTFGRQKRPKRVFSVAADAPRLIADALQLLAPGGDLLLCTNHRETSTAALKRMVKQGAAARNIARIESPPLPPDFAGDPDYAKTLLVRLAKP